MSTVRPLTVHANVFFPGDLLFDDMFHDAVDHMVEVLRTKHTVAQGSH